MRSFVLESALDVCHVKDPLGTSGTDLYAVCRIGRPDEHSSITLPTGHPRGTAPRVSTRPDAETAVNARSPEGDIDAYAGASQAPDCQRFAATIFGTRSDVLGKSLAHRA